MELIVKKKFNIFKVLILTFLVVSVLFFIISSIYDWKIAEIFAKGFSNKISKIWIIFMDELGMYIFEPSVFVMFAIWWETFVLYQKKYAKNEFFNKNVWVSYIFYIVCFVLSALFIYFQTIQRFADYDSGFGSSFDPKLLESISWRHWSYAIVRVIQVSLMLFGAYYCRYIFSKRKDVFTQEYWIDAFKGMLYMMTLALMILAVKWSFGRPFYYNNIFSSILEEIEARGYTYNPNIIKWGAGVGARGDVPYFEWWEPNGFFENMKYWFASDSAGNLSDNAWWNRAFPSGHTTSNFAAFGLWFCFLGEHKGRKLTNKKIAVLVFCFLLLNSMKFSLMVYRFHWLSDLEFSTIFSILMIPAVNSLVDKHMTYFINLFKTRALKQTIPGVVIETKNGFYLCMYKEFGYQKISYYISPKKSAPEKSARKWKNLV
ncbi:hypothetical protein SCLARK_001138 [Spiroplasma clarkii]|uniref:phosphatase PAP2 family protein n=1 Tax=Spiroplasma clarkii TaxID=2139 RepID=UPI000B54F27D|nr:phosphatase PAP2 family protein [Spiroplasma clarkii]ARU91699.1 hypothetical protein SCLARK_001138 [Spiroplasma clarkii]